MSLKRRVSTHTHSNTRQYTHTHPSPWHRSPPTHLPCHAKKGACTGFKEREEVRKNKTARPATPSSNAKATGWSFVMYINLCRSFTWQGIVLHDPPVSSLQPFFLRAGWLYCVWRDTRRWSVVCWGGEGVKGGTGVGRRGLRRRPRRVGVT